MYKKLIFILNQDSDGYPPVGFESVWAIHRSGSTYTIDNIPFFTREATLGDLVDTIAQDGELRYVSTIQKSENSLIRLVYYKETDPDKIRRELQQIGCSTELDADNRLVSINIPPEVDIKQVQTILHMGFEQDRWDYEEAILRQ